MFHSMTAFALRNDFSSISSLAVYRSVSRTYRRVGSMPNTVNIFITQLPVLPRAEPSSKDASMLPTDPCVFF